jgi:hypothetical protein
VAGDKPKVEGGLLSTPYPIKTRGDASRARVLPNVRAGGDTTPALERAPKATPALQRKQESERPVSGFDYVLKRRKLQREIQGGR